MLHGTFTGIPGVETGAEFLRRVSSAFTRIAAAHREGHMLVVSHGLTLPDVIGASFAPALTA